MLSWVLVTDRNPHRRRLSGILLGVPVVDGSGPLAWIDRQDVAVLLLGPTYTVV